MAVVACALEEAVTLNPQLRALLVCPKCRAELEDHAAGLACQTCRRVYPVIDGVPRMVPEESRKL